MVNAVLPNWALAADDKAAALSAAISIEIFLLTNMIHSLMPDSSGYTHSGFPPREFSNTRDPFFTGETHPLRYTKFKRQCR